MSKIATSRDDLRDAARISEDLAEDMWSPSATVKSIGCLHSTITDARQALADFWVGERLTGDTSSALKNRLEVSQRTT